MHIVVVDGTVVKLFSAYYSKAKFPIKSIEQREFGAGWRGKIDKRHISFFTEEELRHFLVEETPMYVSHSTAYYRKPSAPMKEKDWLGADLIFDMDSDIVSKEAVDEVHRNTLELLDILKEDFGVKDYLFVFSGNRGFHIHVRDERFLSLGTEERKAIIEYVQAVNFDYALLFWNEGEMLRGPKPDDPGYKGRFARRAIELMEKEPKKFYRNITPEQQRSFIEGVKNGIWSRLPVKNVVERLKPVASSLEMPHIAADGAVTYDVSKLIRVPNSLHGSTGFRVLPLKNPENFAIEKCLAFSDEPIKVEFLETFSYDTLLGKLEGVKGKATELPLYEAVFLSCQGKAKILG